MNQSSDDDEPAPCIEAKYSDIADKLKRAQLESEHNERMRNLPNPISTDEE